MTRRELTFILTTFTACSVTMSFFLACGMIERNREIAWTQRMLDSEIKVRLKVERQLEETRRNLR